MLPAGAVLTGSAVKCLERPILRVIFWGLPVQIGFPQGMSGVVDKIDDPGFVTATGLLVWGTKHEPVRYGVRLPDFEKHFVLQERFSESFFRNV